MQRIFAGKCRQSKEAQDAPCAPLACPFHSAVSQSPPLRATSFQRKEGERCFGVSSFRAKARNLFRSRSGEAVRSAGNGKHRSSCDWGVRRLMQTALRRKTGTGDEKDPSAALGMTKRGGTSNIPFHPIAVSQPPALRATSFQRKEEECHLPYSEAFSPYRHFERMREIFFVCGQEKL